MDGDTIVIDRGRGNERVRYVGIDTPRVRQAGHPRGQVMAKEASAANEALVAGRDVVLERDVSDADQYDRLLRYVWLREGNGWVFVNLELVCAGATRRSPPTRRTSAGRTRSWPPSGRRATPASGSGERRPAAP